VSRPSPQTDRIVTLVNLLATHPDEGFTLSEIARRLGVSKATCSPMLVALTSAGFLVRHPARKTYRLGPALISAGQAAAAGFPALEAARPVLLELSDQLGVIGMAVAPAGDRLRLVDLAWDPRRHAPTLRVGQELPFRPPWGSVFVAWGTPEDVAAWVMRADDPSVSVDQYRDALAVTRRRGYTVELQAETRGRVRELAEALAGAVSERDRESLVERLLVEVSDRDQPLLAWPVSGRDYNVGAIDAPVFDEQGSVTLALSAGSFEGSLTGDEVVHVGERLRTAASEITASFGGHFPPVIAGHDPE
jgi:DNA-binding IclR family transcriptional regulator